MKIIFLDIDGVLNTSATFIKIKNKHTNKVPIDEFRLKYLKQIIDNTDAKIVLSSTWRFFFGKNHGIIEPIKQKGFDLYNLLKKHGMEIYDFTIKNNYLKREDQITLWLNNNDVENFIILDNESYDLQKFIDKLIKTVENNECIGLCEKHVLEAVELLNSKVKVLK